MVRETKALEEAIEVPEGTKVAVENSMITVSGQKGDVSRNFADKEMRMEFKENRITIKAAKANKQNKKRLKTKAAHIRNMIKGATDGHFYTLKICSGHFPMNVSIQDDELVVKNFLGEKVPRKLKLRGGSVVKVEGDKIVVESAIKEIAGQVSADIEGLTRRTNYDTRVFQDGIYIVNKDGKDVV